MGSWYGLIKMNVCLLRWYNLREGLMGKCHQTEVHLNCGQSKKQE